MQNVSLSSICFQERELPRLCQCLVENKIDKLELSGNLKHITDKQLRVTFREYQNNVQFYIHNYFPSHAEPFVLNLAHPKTVFRAIKHCRKAIDLCYEFGIKQYSLHSGTAISPEPEDLGNLQAHLPPFKMNESREILIEACLEVAEYAKKKHILLLLENNVVASFNCPNGVNDRYHLADLEESAYLMSLFKHPSIGMLLDTGHLKVSAQTLNFDPIKFIEWFKLHIKALHISENDGIVDQNLPVSKNSWFWNYIPWKQVDYVSLEISGQSFKKLLNQIQLTRNKIWEAQNGSVNSQKS